VSSSTLEGTHNLTWVWRWCGAPAVEEAMHLYKRYSVSNILASIRLFIPRSIEQYLPVSDNMCYML
jgi:hypothetical protein